MPDRPKTLAELLDFTYRRSWSHLRTGSILLANGQDMIEVLGVNSSPNTLDEAAVERVQEELERRELKPVTVTKKLTALKHLMEAARDVGWIKEIPSFDRPRQESLPARYLTEEEEAQLFAQLHEDDPEMARLSVFLLETGSKFTEAREMVYGEVVDTWWDIYETDDLETVNRSIPLTDRALDVLEAQRSSRSGDYPWRHLGQMALIHAWRRAANKLGWRDSRLTPSVLRDTCGIRLIRGGVSFKTVQAWLGLKTPSQVYRLLELDEPDLLQARRTLEHE